MEDFQGQLQALGLRQGDTVLVHSSMKALGTDRTPQAVIDDLLAVLGPKGTLLMPALTYASVTTEHPYFSVKTAKPCIGLLPTTFWQMDGVMRSLHPTHSVCAYGKYAREITAGHEQDETPVGPNSPFMRLLSYGGKLLFLGDILHACTFMHGVEEAFGTSYVLKKERVLYTLEDMDGSTITRAMFPHDFAGWGQAYQRIKEVLAYPDIREGKVGEATCYLVDAGALMAKATSLLEKDEHFFVTAL